MPYFRRDPLSSLQSVAGFRRDPVPSTQLPPAPKRQSPPGHRPDPASSMPSLPGLGPDGVPSLPSIPGVRPDAVPSMPSMPGMPPMPGLSPDAVPSMQSLPAMQTGDLQELQDTAVALVENVFSTWRTERGGQPTTTVAGVDAAIQVLQSADAVEPGERVSIPLAVTNDTDALIEVKLELGAWRGLSADKALDAVIKLTPQTVRVAPGLTSDVTLDIAVGSAAADGVYVAGVKTQDTQCVEAVVVVVVERSTGV